jgi:hypothetical protein
MEAKLSLNPRWGHASTVYLPFRVSTVYRRYTCRQYQRNRITCVRSYGNAESSATHKALAATLVTTCLVSGVRSYNQSFDHPLFRFDPKLAFLCPVSVPISKHCCRCSAGPACPVPEVAISVMNALVDVHAKLGCETDVPKDNCRSKQCGGILVIISWVLVQVWNAGHASAVTSLTGEQSQRYREELEQLIKARMKPGERALPTLTSSPKVTF